MLFELLTGDFLFEPRNNEQYDPDQDHLAQMIELLGPIPKEFSLSGKFSKKYFNRSGELKKISGLQFWPLENVLIEK